MDSEIKKFCTNEQIHFMYAMYIMGFGIIMNVKNYIYKHKEKRETGIEPVPKEK